GCGRGTAGRAGTRRCRWPARRAPPALPAVPPPGTPRAACPPAAEHDAQRDRRHHRRSVRMDRPSWAENGEVDLLRRVYRIYVSSWLHRKIQLHRRPTGALTRSVRTTVRGLPPAHGSPHAPREGLPHAEREGYCFL